MTDLTLIHQAPPPVTGRSIAAQRTVAALEPAVAAPVRRRSAIVPWAVERQLQQLRHVAAWRRRRTTARVGLFSDSGTGLLGTLLAALLIDRDGRRLVLFHHSSSYCRERDWRMAQLIARRPHALHIVLSVEHGEQLTQRYGPLTYRAVPNTFVLEEGASSRPSAPTEGGLRIGFISNLHRGKGFDAFLGAASVLLDRGLISRAEIAGPAPDSTVSAEVTAAVARSGGAMRWWGSVSGADKAAFFDSIDVLVFPTRYRDEAQPLVLFEAIARGLPVIASDRGYIREQVGAAGVLLPADPSVEDVVASITDLVGDPRRMDAATAAAGALRALHAPGAWARTMCAAVDGGTP